MTKAEYIVVKYYCHIRCTPKEVRCKDCHYLKAYKQVYGDEEYNNRIIMI